MIVLLDTSTSICKLSLIISDTKKDYEWQSDRLLSKGIFEFIRDKLAENNLDWPDISSIGVFKGPGSFTGLRIGLTVANTIADSMKVPIVGETESNWQQKSIERLKNGQNDQIVLPFYGAGPNITISKK